MSADRSRERRHLAAEFMATAKLISDSNIRTSIVALAQKWLDLAERGSGEPESSSRVVRLRAIQTSIGQELRAEYEWPPELSHRMLTLLMQLNAPPDAEHGEAAETRRSPAHDRPNACGGSDAKQLED
jgi:hypothetical protein